jgi:hypothetical protein
MYGWLPFSAIVDGEYKGDSLTWVMAWQFVFDPDCRFDANSPSYVRFGSRITSSPMKSTLAYLRWWEGEWFDSRARPIKVSLSCPHFTLWRALSSRDSRSLEYQFCHSWGFNYGGEYAFKK